MYLSSNPKSFDRPSHSPPPPLWSPTSYHLVESLCFLLQPSLCQRQGGAREGGGGGGSGGELSVPGVSLIICRHGWMFFARLLSQKPGWASFILNEYAQEGSANEMVALCHQWVGTNSV